MVTGFMRVLMEGAVKVTMKFWLSVMGGFLSELGSEFPLLVGWIS